MPGEPKSPLSFDDLEDYDGDLEKLPTEEVPLEATQIGTPIALMPREFVPGNDPGGTTIVPVGIDKVETLSLIHI